VKRIYLRGFVNTVMNTVVYLWVLSNVRDLVIPQIGSLKDQGQTGNKAMMK
jgi:hypothetical protein